MDIGKKSGVRFTVLCIKEQLVKMIGAHALMTMYLLFVTGCITQKVYFDCGAKVDVVDVQGLILSPGFPYNYSSGIHCVWQFFVPIDYQLILEMFDFDVFESHDSVAVSDSEEDLTEEETKTFAPRRLAAEDDDDDNEEDASLAKVLIGQSEQVFSKGMQSSYSDEVQDMVLQEELMKIEGDHVSESAKRASNKGQPDIRATPRSPRLWIPVAQPPGGKASDSSISTSSSSSYVLLSPPLGGLHSGPSSHPGGARTTTTISPLPPSDTPAPSPETPQPMLDACPHDVLYISDLITFSSRFCGSNRPPSSQLVFGSSQEMVEVIMELITTTHWGRGFALLFHYHNLTERGGDRRTYTHASGRMDTLLAAVSAAVFFVMILASVLCMIFRPKLCPKRSNSCVSSNSEVAQAVEHAVTEVSELRVVTANEGEREVSGDQLTKRPSPVDRRTQPVSMGGKASRYQELELSPGGLMELDLGADEVFIMSSDPSHPGLPLSAHTRERYLRYSDTGPRPLSDWPLPDPTTTSSQGPTAARPEGGSGCTRSRPRAWSVRTFQDYLPPLHKKWCSWNSTSPFTKLVDTTPPSLGADGPGDNGRKVFSEAHLSNKPNAGAGDDSAISSASYPLTAHRQRRLNSTSNLRRSLFTGACFGLLSGTDDPARAPPGAPAQTPGPASSPSSQQPHDGGSQNALGGKRRDLSTDETDHVSVPVFAISEEEDRVPLVPAEHLAQTSFSSTSLSPSSSMLNGLTGGLYQERRPPPLC